MDVWTSKEKIIPTPWFVVPLCIFSGVSISTWILYSYRVKPFIHASIKRCKIIEDIFGKLGLELGEQLNSKIQRYDHSDMKDEYHRRCRYGGLWCLWSFVVGLIIAWGLLILFISGWL